jgi:acyl-coenzyme A synthetase/AMP-(fatty) acid ligase
VSNLSAALTHRAAENPNDPALVWSSGTLSFSQLDNAVNLVARKLLDSGVEPQERVVIFSLPPQLDFILFLALVRIGATSISSNKVSAVNNALFDWQVVYGRPEIDSIIPGSRLVVTDESWIDVLTEGPAVTPYEFSDDEPCRILSTSGTTGREKLAVYGHGALARKMKSGSVHWVSDLLEFNLMPLGAIGGLYTSLNSLERGKPYFLLKGKGKQLLDHLVRSNVEILSGSPYQVAETLKSLEDTQLRLKNLKKIRLAGALTSERLRNYIISQYPVEVSAVYGSTECGGVFAKDIASTSNLADLGVLLEGVQVCVNDTNDIQVGTGQMGSLGCKTSSMYMGYLKPDGSIKIEHSGGWFFPGDFVIQGTGSVTFVGRDSDILNVGGIKIDATELDEFARGFDGVIDALSFESEDKSGKPALAMAVVPGPGFEMATLVAALNRSFPNAAPQLLGEVKSIPRTELGKPQRASLARAFSALSR